MNDVMRLKQALDPELFVRLVNEKNRARRMEREAAESKIIEFPRKGGANEQRMEARPPHLDGRCAEAALALLKAWKNEATGCEKRRRVPDVRITTVPLREVWPVEEDRK